MALGASFTSAQISGMTTTSFAGVTTTTPAALVAPRWRIFAGYDLTYWPDVQRTGSLIDTTVNPNLILPPLPGGP